jgi:hypothetical protein
METILLLTAHICSHKPPLVLYYEGTVRQENGKNDAVQCDFLRGAIINCCLWRSLKGILNRSQSGDLV